LLADKIDEEFLSFEGFGMSTSSAHWDYTDEFGIVIDLSELPSIEVDDRPIEEEWGLKDVRESTSNVNQLKKVQGTG
jgi:hypothetical protein